MKNISLIVPTRNNLDYLHWNYNRMRKLYPEVEFCVADDFSSDGTKEWCEQIASQDEHFKFIRNDGPERLGHTILYDKLINEVSTREIIGIWHADMYASKGMLEAVLEEIDDVKVVSVTRIEPELHPPGPEKIILDFGQEPEEFEETSFEFYVEEFKRERKGQRSEGIFAPWFIYKSNFQQIDGHDDIFAPQSKEDSDIFNRFVMNGMVTVQLLDAFCYHLTCRGSRYNPYLTRIGTESEEWLKQNERSARNFVRKWGTVVIHTPELKPIIANKYLIRYVLKGKVQPEMLEFVEPFSYKVVVENQAIVEEYITKEQKNTKFDLSRRVFYSEPPLSEHENVVEINLDKCPLPMFKDAVVKMQGIIDEKQPGKIDVTEYLSITIRSKTSFEDVNIKGQEYLNI